VIQLTDDPIDAAAAVDAVRSPSVGAVVVFLGTVRGTTDGRETDSLDYECYPEMAKKKLTELETEAQQRWPLVACAIIHRLGQLRVGEASVAVAAGSPHRREAFETAEWLIDRIKQVVPIWKKENYADGTSDWVHPSAGGECGMGNDQ
jgi:molybdopterin synthase catalytic subunit